MIPPLVRPANFSLAFSNGWNLYKNNFGPVFLGMLIVTLLGIVSCGICAAPLLCGFFAMILQTIRNAGSKPSPGSVMDGFQKFGPAFVSYLVINLIGSIAGFVLGLVPVLGVPLAIVANLLSTAIGYWALLLVTDRNATIGEAIGESLKQIGNGPFWAFVLVTFVAGLVGALGIIGCGIGVLFTVPLGMCIITAAYEESYGSVAPRE